MFNRKQLFCKPKLQPFIPKKKKSLVLIDSLVLSKRNEIEGKNRMRLFYGQPAIGSNWNIYLLRLCVSIP